MKNTFNQIYKFIITGGFSTALDYVIYILLYKHIGVISAKLLSILTATLFSLIINKSWTFRYNENITKHLLFKYYFAQTINIICNISINTIFFKLTQLVNLSFIIATGIATIINFILQKFFVFKKIKELR